MLLCHGHWHGAPAFSKLWCSYWMPARVPLAAQMQPGSRWALLETETRTRMQPGNLKIRTFVMEWWIPTQRRFATLGWVKFLVCKWARGRFQPYAIQNLFWAAGLNRLNLCKIFLLFLLKYKSGTLVTPKFIYDFMNHINSYMRWSYKFIGYMNSHMKSYIWIHNIWILMIISYEFIVYMNSYMKWSHEWIHVYEFIYIIYIIFWICIWIHKCMNS